jgi:4-amino-4-deoxy-L-arabinose transferase-like glycosyltransferase
MNETKSSSARDFGIGAALCVGYVALLWVTAPDLAMSRDESFYAYAAKSYGEWLRLLFDEPGRALQRASLDRAWRVNWEHPPGMKLAFAASWLVHQRFDLFPCDSMAFRFPAMLTAGLLLSLIYVWGSAVMRRPGALFAALAFATMPRVFYHAHLDCFDVPIAFFVTLTAYLYWRSLDDRRWAPWVGVAFGLALATKHNAWMLPGVLGVHYAWLRSARASARSMQRPSIAWLPYSLVFGPLIFFASWPWLWSDTWARLARYTSFHLRHVHYTYRFFGVSYFEPPLPVSVPFVMTLFTVSIVVLVLFSIGLWTYRHELRPPWRAAVGDDVGRLTGVLWLGCLAAPLLAIALPTTPIFGGTKHWLTAYPFLALFAGRGFLVVTERAAPAVWRARVWPVYAFLGVCLMPGVVQTHHSHPFGLSHYMPIVGGVQGAADLGMNRQFWGFTTGSVIPWLLDALPEGGAVWLCDTTPGAWAMLQADGLVPKSLRAVPSMAEADYALVHHERHFAEVDHQLWALYGTSQPVHVLRYDGVPIVSIYENPRRSPQGEPD